MHLVRRGFLNAYQHWRKQQTSAVDKQSRKLPRPTTLNGEFSTIKRMWKGVALTEGFITRDQLPEIPYAKSPKNQTYLRSSFSVEECVQLEKAARTYWIEGKSRYDEEGNFLGYHQISRGPNKGKESDRPITKNSLYGVNKGKGTKRTRLAKQQQVHRQMLYLAMRICMESGIRISSLRKMR